MRLFTAIFALFSLTLFFTACTIESDPAPRCTTKAITYQEFKDNYRPEDKFLSPESTNNIHFKGLAFDNQQIQQREIVETVKTYEKK